MYHLITVAPFSGQIDVGAERMTPERTRSLLKRIEEEGCEFLVPVRDAPNVISRRISQGWFAMQELERLCEKKGVAVQAGGNWGYWPLRLASMFETVYTFEPDPVCFAALTANTRDMQNVVRLQAAVGIDRGLVKVVTEDDDTTGNQYVKEGGIIPTLRIDDLALTECDLIYLDVEGMEYDAFGGAMETLLSCRPIVAFEVCKKYDSDGRVQKMLETVGYEKIDNIGRDVVMQPGPNLMSAARWRTYGIEREA